MLPIALLWIFVVATLVVFGVDIAQQRRKDINNQPFENYATSSLNFGKGSITFRKKKWKNIF